jgi:peptide/nickel transport system substrate-binding protein
MWRMLRIAAIALAASIVSLASSAREREVAIGLQAAITSIEPHYHNLSPNNSLLLHI